MPRILRTRWQSYHRNFRGSQSVIL